MRWISAAYSVTVFLLSAAVCVAPARPQDHADPSTNVVQVFAAASTTSAIGDVKRLFSKATGIDIQTSFGSSGALARQIANGADADVFVSADTKWADDLAEKGLVAQRRDSLGNRLVIVTLSDCKMSVTNPKDLASASIAHIAMGEPNSVPAGAYAMKAFEKLGLWEEIRPKVAAANDVRIALTYVETGAAEAGVVYATDAAICKRVRVVVELPESLTGPIRYPIILLTHGKDSAAVQSFYRFLGSPQSLKVFRTHGFSILNSTKVTDRRNQ